MSRSRAVVDFVPSSDHLGFGSALSSSSYLSPCSASSCTECCRSSRGNGRRVDWRPAETSNNRNGSSSCSTCSGADSSTAYLAGRPSSRPCTCTSSCSSCSKNNTSSTSQVSCSHMTERRAAPDRRRHGARADVGHYGTESGAGPERRHGARAVGGHYGTESGAAAERRPNARQDNTEARGARRGPGASALPSMRRLSNEDYVVEYYHADYPCFDPNCKGYEPRLPPPAARGGHGSGASVQAFDRKTAMHRQANGTSHDCHPNRHHRQHGHSRSCCHHHDCGSGTAPATAAVGAAATTSTATAAPGRPRHVVDAPVVVGSGNPSGVHTNGHASACCGGCRRPKPEEAASPSCQCCCHNTNKTAGEGHACSGEVAVPAASIPANVKTTGTTCTTNLQSSSVPDLTPGGSGGAGMPTVAIATTYETMCFPDGRSTATLTRTQKGYGPLGPNFVTQSFMGGDPGAGSVPMYPQQQFPSQNLGATDFGRSGQLGTIGGVPVVVPVRALRREGVPNVLLP